MKLIKLFVDLCSRQPTLFYGSLVLSVVSNALQGMTILTLVPVLDFLLNPNLNDTSNFTKHLATAMGSLGIPVTLGSLMGVAFVFAAITGGVSVVEGRLTIQVRYVVLRDLIRGAFKDFFSARWQFFSGGSQGMLLNTFTREISTVGESLTQMSLFFASLVRFAAFLVVPFYLSWQVTLISVAVAGVLAAPFFMLSGVGYRLGRRNTATGNDVMSVLHENLSLAKLVIGFGNQEKALRRLTTSFDQHARVTVAYQALNQAIGPAYRPLGLLVLAVTLFAARWFGVPLSETGVILFSLSQTFPLAGSFAGLRVAISNVAPSYEQIQDLRRQATTLQQASGTRIFGEYDVIDLDRVSFAYPDCRPTLTDISLQIQKGKMVAIVGESGAGKSTLIDLIMGFHEPGSGEILFDGVPLPAFDVNSYRQCIGYVPQDGALFNTSIRENLLWANESATEADLWHACGRANATEFIDELPLGLDTVVGDRGVRLSGGQIQRVALARAILRKPALLILDEATSALDSRSERLIHEAIDAITRETTVIVIAHRLSTVKNADRIVVLRDGRIAEEGTYETLLATDRGYFKTMANLQDVRALPWER